VSGTAATYAGTPCVTAPLPAVVVRPSGTAPAAPVRNAGLLLAWTSVAGSAGAGFAEGTFAGAGFAAAGGMTTGIPTGPQLIDRGPAERQLQHIRTRTTPGDLPPRDPLS